MNREILFRGKRVDGRGWVTGYYVYRPDGKHLIYWQPFDDASQNTYHKVAPATVGQYTGLKDKDGTRIFEGDVIIAGEDGDYIDQVVFDNAGFRLLPTHDWLFDYAEPNEDLADLGLRILGNIYDNKELWEIVK